MLKIKNWFSRRGKQDASLTPDQKEEKVTEELDEWYEAEEEDGILQKIEKPRATTFKKKWIYGIGIVFIVIFSVSLVMGLYLGTHRKIKTVEEEPQQQNIVKGAHLQNIQKNEEDKKLQKIQEKKAPQQTPQPVEPPQSPPSTARTYSPVPQSRYIPQTPPTQSAAQVPQHQLTAEEKEALQHFEAKQKANKSPIKFDLKEETT